MDTITNLRTFMAVVHYESFAAAARHLHVVPSVVAKRIAQLEKTIGARLFERSTRTVKITEAGQRLLPRVRQTIEQFDDLLHDVRRDDGKLEGHIRIMLPTTLTMMHLGSALVEFMAVHNRITLDIVLADHSINPLEEDVDIIVSGRTAHYDGVIQIPLSPINTVLCASRDYVEGCSPITHPSQLTEHPCLVFKPQSGTWVFTSPKGPIYVDVQPVIKADDNRTLCYALERGLGIGLLPTYILKKGLDSGSIVPLLQEFPPQQAWFKAYVPRRKQGLARIDALVEWLRQSLEEFAGAAEKSP